MQFVVDPDRKRARLIGELTEDDDLFALLVGVEGEIVLDLSGVTRISSAGSHAWMRFVEGLPNGSRLVLEGCPTAFVTLATLVADFLGRAEVRSVILPYLCPACSMVVDRPVDLHQIGATGLPPSGSCPACSRPLRLDALEEHYLSLAAALRGHPPS